MFDILFVVVFYGHADVQITLPLRVLHVEAVGARE